MKIPFGSEAHGKYLEEGVYHLRIKSETTALSKSGSNTTLTLELEGFGESAGKQGKLFFTINEKNMWKLMQLCKATGVIRNDEVGSGSFDSEELVGKTFVLHRKSDGVDHNTGYTKWKDNYLPTTEDVGY